MKKYGLNDETLVRWEKKLKGTKAVTSVHFVKAKHGKKKNSKTKSEKPVVNEKEDELLSLVASLIVQSLLQKDSPDR